MSSFPTIARDLGQILRVVSLTMAASMLIAAFVGEWFALPAFAVSALLTAGVGSVLVYRHEDAPAPGKREAMITAALAWLSVAFLGALPFLGISWTIALQLFPAWMNTPALTDTTAVFNHPLDGIFESISGFTSTGLTMALVEDDLPRSLHWWRSFTEWVGGVGVIVLTVAILARPGSGSLTLFRSEARSKKIHPSIVSTVTEIWRIYVGFTLAAIALFWLAGMPLWGAINHAMTAISTGGFSIHADSIGHYGSALIEYTVIGVMIVGSIAFPVHYLLLQGHLKPLWRDVQTRWVFLWFAIGAAALIAVLVWNGQYGTLEENIRNGLFQFVSATSNTGFGTTTIGAGETAVWSIGAVLIVCLGMLTGAAAGSTVGGLKLIRVITLVKGTVWQLKSVFVPKHAIRQLKIGNRTLSEPQAEHEYTEATVVVVLWMLGLIVGVGVLLAALPPGYPLQHVLFEVMSAQSNVGLDSGIVSPTMPDSTKIMLIVNMWVGRLEIIPVAVLIGVLLQKVER